MIRHAETPRVVCDCNVLLQAVSNEHGAAGRVLAMMDRGQIVVFLSRPVVAGLRAVLQYPQVREQFDGLTDETINTFVQRLTFRGAVSGTFSITLVPDRTSRTLTWLLLPRLISSSQTTRTYWH